jgi:nucleotide-binding universal stress UspA family protein
MYKTILVPLDGSRTSKRELSRLVMGSDAEQIVRSSPVPVLTVRAATAR